jgi:broad specificity phosphatase PhoE
MMIVKMKGNSLLEIIIIQHCQSEHHINNMSGGWTDTSLTELGRNQANLIGQRLKKKLTIADYVIYSSDLKRAWETAEIIGGYLNLEIIADMELREINTGVAAGKTKEWANKHRNPGDRGSFNLDYQAFQNGETWRQFYYRVCSCMKRIMSSEAKKIIIVTHGGTLGYIIAWWMEFEESMLSKSYFTASPASISVLKVNTYQQHILNLLNDTSHLI